MKSVRVKKEELLLILKKNLEKHEQTFSKAWEGYKKVVIEELDRRLEDAKNGRKINLYFELVEPMNQTSDYKRAIGMLEMSVEDVIELTQDEYSCYVLDEWRWSGQFAITSSRYL